MNPVISTIIPTRNRQTLLGEALASVEAQGVTDLEVLVIDDASDRPDHTAAVVGRFSDRLDVRLLALDARGGPAKARNAGIAASRGEYVAFLDDDDLWHPGKLRKQLERFRRNPKRLANLGVVYVWHQWVDAKTGRIRKQRRPRLQSFDDIFRCYYNIIPTVMVRRDCLVDVGGFDEATIQENQDLHARLAQRFQYDAVEEILVTCRHHAGPRISDDFKDRLRGLQRLLERYAPKVSDPRVLHELRFRHALLLLQASDRARARREFGEVLRIAPLARKPRYLISGSAALLGFVSLRHDEAQ